MLRQFLYLDRDLVREFLSQAEGGLYDESRETTTSEGRRGVSAKVAAGPASAGVDRAKAHQVGSEAVIKQTSGSEFNRLYDVLGDSGLQIYDVIDEKLDDLPIKRQDLIEVDSRLRVSGLQTMLDLIGTFNELAPMMERLGATTDSDTEALEGIQALSALARPDRPLPVIATVPGDCRLQIALELRRAGLQTDDWNTEATVLLKVQRVLRPGDRQIVGDPFGGLMNVVPEAQRQEVLASLRSEELAGVGVGEAEVAYPGLIGTPIAIYR